MNQEKKLVHDFWNEAACGENLYLEIKTILGHGDLLTSPVGQRHKGVALTLARLIWPRWIIKKLFKYNGLAMLITARK